MRKGSMIWCRAGRCAMTARVGSPGLPNEGGTPRQISEVVNQILRRFDIPASFPYVATSIDARFFTADKPMKVRGIVGCVTVAGTDAGAVTATVRKVPSGT